MKRSLNRRSNLCFVMGTALALVGLGASQAWASTSWSIPTKYYPKCIYAWGVHGADPYVNGHSSGITLSPTHVYIGSWYAQANSGPDCYYDGAQTKAPASSITIVFTLYGTALTCGAAFPIEFSCGQAPSDVVFKTTFKCSYVASCSISGSGANYYPSSFGDVTRVTEQIIGTWASGGSQYTVGPTTEVGSNT